MYETIILYCKRCDIELKSIETSPTIESDIRQSKLVDINLQSVMATTAAGEGLAMLRRLCINLNLPEPVTENPYANYLRHFNSHATSKCDLSLRRAVKELMKDVLLKGEPDSGQIFKYCC